MGTWGPLLRVTGKRGKSQVPLGHPCAPYNPCLTSLPPRDTERWTELAPRSVRSPIWPQCRAHQILGAQLPRGALKDFIWIIGDKGWHRVAVEGHFDAGLSLGPGKTQIPFFSCCKQHCHGSECHRVRNRGSDMAEWEGPSVILLGTT